MKRFTTCLRGRVQFMTDKQLLHVFDFIRRAVISRGLDGENES